MLRGTLSATFSKIKTISFLKSSWTRIRLTTSKTSWRKSMVSKLVVNLPACNYAKSNVSLTNDSKKLDED